MFDYLFKILQNLIPKYKPQNDECEIKMQNIQDIQEEVSPPFVTQKIPPIQNPKLVELPGDEENWLFSK